MDDLFAPKRPEIAPNVLFVCTGNICRSAYAQQALRALLQRTGNPYGLSVASAGTFAVVGSGIEGTTAHVVAERGFPTTHTARQLSPKVADSAGLVLVMTRDHRDDVLGRFPALTHRTFTLSEFASLAAHAAGATTFSDAVAAISRARHAFSHAPEHDVPDPYRKPLAEHEQAATQIDALLQQSLPALTRGAER